MKYLIASIIVLISTITFAQETANKKYFYTRQECYPAKEFMSLVMDNWKEEALFTGNSWVLDTDGKAFQGGAMFFVNQDTGTWTIASLYGDGTICIVTAGTEFSPFSLDKRKGEKS